TGDDDAMIQCMICEDWFHSQHLGVPLPMEENEADQSDMICQGCVLKYPFLIHYDGKKKEYNIIWKYYFLF
ncbi:unnamed protein product, partial [Rotaria magnacalcarata]